MSIKQQWVWYVNTLLDSFPIENNRCRSRIRILKLQSGERKKKPRCESADVWRNKGDEFRSCADAYIPENTLPVDSGSYPVIIPPEFSSGSGVLTLVNGQLQQTPRTRCLILTLKADITFSPLSPDSPGGPALPCWKKSNGVKELTKTVQVFFLKKYLDATVTETIYPAPISKTRWVRFLKCDVRGPSVVQWTQ